MAITDKARDFWERISPRERRLVLLAAVAVPLTIAVWLGLAILFFSVRGMWTRAAPGKPLGR